MPPATPNSHPIPLTFPVLIKLASAGFAFFVAGNNDGSVGALIPYILRGYNTHTGSLAILYASGFTGWVTAALVSVYARVYIGMGGAVVLGAGLQLLAQALRVWHPPFGLFSSTFFLAALGTALQDSQANTFVSSVKFAHRWLGIIHASYGIGCVTGPLVATAMALSRPEKWVYFYWTLFGLGTINFALVTLAFRTDIEVGKGSEEGAEAEGRFRNAWSEMRATVKERAVWLLSLFFFFHLGVGVTSGGFLVEYLVTIRKEPLSRVGYISTSFYGGLALGRLLLAEPTFRYGERRMLLLYSFLCLVLQVVFWKAKNIVGGWIVMSCMGFLLGPYFATGVSIGTKLLPHKIHACALGLVFVIAQAGGAIFPAITGLIATKAGVEVLQPILIGLIVAMGSSWVLVPAPKQKG
ncbi:MFS transporter [Glonium stellatum]|uniref:MFS transporter n=1 Tax=Glonium stellatum TaxID=574774 RepID=A0A8E2JRU7_9PEZI|nr:MFS transporter [Glonium stellatum]